MISHAAPYLTICKSIFWIYIFFEINAKMDLLFKLLYMTTTTTTTKLCCRFFFYFQFTCDFSTICEPIIIKGKSNSMQTVFIYLDIGKREKSCRISREETYKTTWRKGESQRENEWNFYFTVTTFLGGGLIRKRFVSTTFICIRQKV